MRFGTSLTLLTVLTGSSAVWAQAALDDEGKPVPTTDPAASPTTPDVTPQLEYGADIRLRYVAVPKGLLDLFVDRSPGGANSSLIGPFGLGLDLVRRRGNLELQLGFEYEQFATPEGVWINSGDNVAGGDEADYMISPERAGKAIGWFTIEFTFLNHAPIGKYVAIRYGGGAGLGIITGGIQKYDVICNGATNENPEPGCVPTGITSPSGAQGTGNGQGGPNDYDLPPVFPVVNAILGVQIRPTPKSVVNIEGGIRTIPFFGISAGYFY